MSIVHILSPDLNVVLNCRAFCVTFLSQPSLSSLTPASFFPAALNMTSRFSPFIYVWLQQLTFLLLLLLFLYHLYIFATSAVQTQLQPLYFRSSAFSGKVNILVETLFLYPNDLLQLHGFLHLTAILRFAYKSNLQQTLLIKSTVFLGVVVFYTVMCIDR